VKRSFVPSNMSNDMPRAWVAVLMLLLFLTAGISPRPSAIVTAQDFSPAGELIELAIDDGSAECTSGQTPALKGSPGFGWANKLTPPSYPATIRAITIGFERNLVITGVKPDSLYRIVVFLDPESDGPSPGQQPAGSFIGRVRGMNEFMTFNLTTPLTIAGGSFVVGAIDDFGIADLPALYDSPGRSNPRGSESFFTFNGGAFWQTLAQGFPADPVCGPGSWMVRATVELGAVDPLSVLKIEDPAAVEPWGIGVLNNDVIVTNLVSDNLTIIDTANNNIVSNFQLVDPRICATCGPPLGPFGIASVPVATPAAKFYVTLFGSHTIPSKEFPTDYSTVLPGRVVVMQRGANGYVQSGLINVGTGPRFPAVAGNKLYVPCGGANRVDVINTLSDLKVGEVAVGSDPSSCTASLDGSKIYVTNFGDGSISVIDTRTDTRIKNVAAPSIVFPTPVGAPVPPAPATASSPWNATVSRANGHLYVTYWGTVGNVNPNGVIAVLDTCKDEFIRVTFDPATGGTPPGSAGSTGIPAPTAPLTRDEKTGRTLEAGGGGGGPFGIAACLPNVLSAQPLAVVFTNDALGIAGVLDSRIDQVVSAPPISSASCPKPRGILCTTANAPPPGGGPPRPTHFAFVACGQPDDSVLVFRVPELPENIPNIPVITSSEVAGVIRLVGSGFANPGVRFEVSRPGSSTCLTFNKNPKFKKMGRVLVQKGRLSDGTQLTDTVNQNAVIRVVNPDGTVRVVRR
jgi:YVTN family beta-propeller protein